MKIRLENRDKINSNVEIEAFVTKQISGSEIPPPNLKRELVQNCLKGYQLADSSASKEKVAILIRADYYCNVVSGRIKRLGKSLVASETIFGWCIIGKNSEVQDGSVSLNVVIEEKLISDQIKRFWELDSLGISEGEVTVPSSDTVLKKFKSEIEYENSLYKIRLPWKSGKKWF